MVQGNPAQVQVTFEKTGKRPNIGGNGFIYWLKKNNLPNGFQVLCVNCNYGKGTNKYCPHEILRGFDLDGKSITENESK